MHHVDHLAHPHLVRSVGVGGVGVRIERVFAWPNKWTFQIDVIAKLINEEMGEDSHEGLWIDPFSGMSTFAHIRNDLNPDTPAQFHSDALTFLQHQAIGRTFDGAHYDPPFSFRQASECYKKHGREHLTAEVTNNGYYAKCKDIIAQVVKTGGKVISCGWNSGGMGKGRGFEIDRILLVNHGGGHNDTIVTVETKVQDTLLNYSTDEEESCFAGRTKNRKQRASATRP